MTVQIRRSSFCVCAGLALLLTLGMPAVGQTVVATLDKQVITDQELQARTDAKLRAQQRSYEGQLRRLNLGLARSTQEYKERELGRVLDDHVLATEAKALNTSVDALLAGIKVPAVKETQMRALYDSQAGQINRPYGDVSTQIREYLEKGAKAEARRRYLDALRAKYHAVVLLEPLRESVGATGPFRGPANAPVTIVEFSDFECPFCGRFEPIIADVMKQHPNQVRLVYRHLPLASLHAEAQKAAEAAVCAQDQGRFWEMHDLLFAQQGSLKIEALKEKAQRLGLDTKQFDDCLDSGKSAAAIAVDTDAAEQLAIDSTPTSFVNGRYLTGAVSADELSDIIRDELRRAGSKALR